MVASSPITRDARGKAQTALSESPIYELRDLLVELMGESLLISGSVDSFYHKQLAQEAVRAVVGKIPMINRVLVRD